MSRSNPEVIVSNPCKRWMEWNGETGLFRYYDKVEKKKIDLGKQGFQFLYLDSLYTISGFDDANQCSITSNEVRSHAEDVFIVKSFKGGTIATGLWKDIKQAVEAKGGKFTVNIYIAFVDESKKFAIGSIKLNGAGLIPWFAFYKANGKAIHEGSIKTVGFTEGTKGRVVYKMPVFLLAPAKQETNDAATALDLELQAYLSQYTKKKLSETILAAEESPFVDNEPQNIPASTPVPNNQSSINYESMDADETTYEHVANINAANEPDDLPF